MAGTYWTAEGLAALRPTEGRYDQIHYPGPHGKSSATGAYGFLDPTWRQQATAAGVDIAKWPRAYMAPPEVQDAVAAITPVRHWTGTDSQGRPFNAAAQRLAMNPKFVTGSVYSPTGDPGFSSGLRRPGPGTGNFGIADANLGPAPAIDPIASTAPPAPQAADPNAQLVAALALQGAAGSGDPFKPGGALSAAVTQGMQPAPVQPQPMLQPGDYMGLSGPLPLSRRLT